MVSAVGFWWATRTTGEFTYALDDPYIHLRLGQNLAEHGVFGVNPDEFASAGSSVIWPLAIAGVIKLTGPLVGIPYVLTLICGVITLVLVDRWARHEALSLAVRVAVMVAMIVVAPLLLMTFTGMEHVLQIGLSILLVHQGIKASFEPVTDRRRLVVLFASALALSATRPEVIFVVAVLGLLLLVKRRVVDAVAIGLGTIVPFAVTAVVNITQGWPALPASIMAKGLTSGTGIARYLPNLNYIMVAPRRPRLVAVVVLVGIALWFGHKVADSFDSKARRWAWVALAITGLHICFSQTGWLMRYEAYLVALCIIALALCAESIRRERAHLELATRTRRMLTVAVVGLALIGLLDGIRINLVGLTGIREIDRQQHEMARFSASNCPGCRVAIGDIGMVALYGDTTVTDLWGLADLGILESKLDGTYGTAAWAEAVRHDDAQWAMVYQGPGIPRVPEDWIKIGEWEWPTAEVVAGRTVHFYAIDPTLVEPLREAFAEYPTPAGATATPA